jgi:5-methylcytosine-specific restriction enzyme A
MSRRVAPLPMGWAATRRRILERWAYICHVCLEAGGVGMEIDHVIPVSRNGSDDDSNLRPIHGRNDPRKCHLRKTAREARGEPRARQPERHPGDVPVKGI